MNKEGVLPPPYFLIDTMIKFTELRVQKGRLTIVAEVREIDDYYDNVYIDKIIVDTQDTFTTSGPSANPIYSVTVDGNQKKFSITLSPTQLGIESIENTMFFVYAKAKGTPAPGTPCGFDDEYEVGVTFSLCPIYNATMGYVKQVNNTCEIPKDFVNMILQFKAIQYSIDSGHFTQAIAYYNKFYKNLSVNTHSTCGCHG